MITEILLVTVITSNDCGLWPEKTKSFRSIAKAEEYFKDCCKELCNDIQDDELECYLEDGYMELNYTNGTTVWVYINEIPLDESE